VAHPKRRPQNILWLVRSTQRLYGLRLLRSARGLEQNEVKFISEGEPGTPIADMRQVKEYILPATAGGAEPPGLS